jgi:plastocyanin
VKRNLAVTIAILMMLPGFALAASMTGKVTGATGASVVWLEAPGKTFPAPEQHVVLDQRNLMFQPHVVVVQVGTTVDFLNSDNVAHNVFWPSLSGDKKAAHNLGTWPKGEKKPFKFEKAGVVPLLCNVHPEMSGYVVVSPTPYFAQTDAAGNYTIANVPDGNYTVTVWHEGAKPVSKPITIKGDTKGDLTAPK